MKLLAPVLEDWTLSVDSKEGQPGSSVGCPRGCKASFREDSVVSQVAMTSLLLSSLLGCLFLPVQGGQRVGGGELV